MLFLDYTSFPSCGLWADANGGLIVRKRETRNVCTCVYAGGSCWGGPRPGTGASARQRARRDKTREWLTCVSSSRSCFSVFLRSPGRSFSSVMPVRPGQRGVSSHAAERWLAAAGDDTAGAQCHRRPLPPQRAAGRRTVEETVQVRRRRQLLPALLASIFGLGLAARHGPAPILK